MPKSADAFRTISEVADWLGIQAHVLRFWESKFTQVKPVKRAGGRRYYRPADMLLLGGIRKLLHDDGLTIKGVQKILREEGMNHVAEMSVPLDEETMANLVADDVAPSDITSLEVEVPPEEKGVVLSFDPTANAVENTKGNVKEEHEPVVLEDEILDLGDAEEAEQATGSESESPAATSTETPVATAPDDIPDTSSTDSAEPATFNDQRADEPVQTAPQDPIAPAPIEPDTPPVPPVPNTADEISEDAANLPAFLQRPLSASDSREESEDAADQTPDEVALTEPVAQAIAPIAEPEVIQNTDPAPAAPLEGAEAAPQNPTPPEQADVAGSQNAIDAAPEPALTPKPRKLDLPPFTPEAEFPTAPSLLTGLRDARQFDAASSAQIAPLLDRLAALRDSMSSRRRGPGGPRPSA